MVPRTATVFPLCTATQIPWARGVVTFSSPVIFQRPMVEILQEGYKVLVLNIHVSAITTGVGKEHEGGKQVFLSSASVDASASSLMVIETSNMPGQVAPGGFSSDCIVTSAF